MRMFQSACVYIINVFADVASGLCWCDSLHLCASARGSFTGRVAVTLPGNHSRATSISLEELDVGNIQRP